MPRATNANDFRIIAPPHTPLRPDGSLRVAQIPVQARWLAHNGVDGVFVAGSTGESLSLTVQERMELAACWVESAVDADMQVIIHVGHNCQRESIRMATHARDMGADAVAFMAPCFFRPTTVAQLVDFLEPIAAAAAELPVYFYDIPELTGVRVCSLEFLRQGSARMPNLAGLKYTNGDLLQLQRCLHFEDGKFEIFFGVDEALLAAYALGVRGAIGSTYNFMAPHYRKMLALADAGDWEAARAHQLQSLEVCRLLQGYGYCAAAKCLMNYLGVDCGTVRPPLRGLTGEEQEKLRCDLKRLDVFPPRLEEAQLLA